MVDRRDFLKLGLAAAAVIPSAAEAQTPAPTPVVTPNANADFDYVIAGGGHNALACAAYLGKAGYKCVVLEAKATVGGNITIEYEGPPNVYKKDTVGFPTANLQVGGNITVTPGKNYFDIIHNVQIPTFNFTLPFP